MSSVADSVERDRDGTIIRELVAILRLSEQALTDMPWTENPCVGGSIPPKATNLNNPSSQWVFLWNSFAGIAQLVERYLAKV